MQPIDSKIQNFNEETLFWIFYSCPADLKQQLAAVELYAHPSHNTLQSLFSADPTTRHNRNWRWHKKLRVWLTKDEHMTPQVLSPSHERGYYIIWDTAEWCKNRVCTSCGASYCGRGLLTGSTSASSPSTTEIWTQRWDSHQSQHE